jgi:hypothetical protein
VGCVASASSQILKYWSYPSVGRGSISYTWFDTLNDITLKRNFTDSAYDWTNMPSILDNNSTDTQINATAKLCADVAIAFQTNFGSETSGSWANTIDAANVFLNYFRYKNSVRWVDRSGYSNQSDWMQVFMTEVVNGRPSQLRIEETQKNRNHSVVVDGYRNTPTETIHINLGWGTGPYNGWYTPDSFTTDAYNWTDLSYGAVIGIQPDYGSLAACFNGMGLWIYNSDYGTWTQISTQNPDQMVFSGSTLFAGFASLGLWKWNGSSWSKLSNNTPNNIVASNSILYGDFGTLGLWQWNGSWSQLSPNNVENISASDSMLYGDFGSLGLWRWNGSSWRQLSAVNPDKIVASGSALYADFGASYGLWHWDGTVWRQLTAYSTEDMTASASICYGNFGQFGLWKWDGSSWSQLSTISPNGIMASGTILYGNFGSTYGLWKWDNTAWIQLSPNISGSMTGIGSLFYCKFTSLGFWKWNGTNWSQLSQYTPDLVAISN